MKKLWMILVILMGLSVCPVIAEENNNGWPEMTPELAEKMLQAMGYPHAAPRIPWYPPKGGIEERQAEAEAIIKACEDKYEELKINYKQERNYYASITECLYDEILKEAKNIFTKKPESYTELEQRLKELISAHGRTYWVIMYENDDCQEYFCGGSFEKSVHLTENNRVLEQILKDIMTLHHVKDPEAVKKHRRKRF